MRRLATGAADHPAALNPLHARHTAQQRKVTFAAQRKIRNLGLALKQYDEFDHDTILS